MKRLNINISDEVDSKLQRIVNKRGKNKTEVVKELILNYEIYNNYLKSIYNDMQLIILSFENLAGEDLRNKYTPTPKKNKLKISPLPKKNKNYNLAYYHVLKDMANKKNIPASKLIDDLIKEEYYQENDKKILYKILDEEKIIYKILEDHLVKSKARSIRISHFKKNNRRDL